MAPSSGDESLTVEFLVELNERGLTGTGCCVLGVT